VSQQVWFYVSEPCKHVLQLNPSIALLMHHMYCYW